MFKLRRLTPLLVPLTLLLASCGTDEAGSTTPFDPVTRDMGGEQDSGETSQPDQREEDDGGEAKEDMRISPPTSCASAGECDAPQICTVDNATGASVCADPIGTNQVGEACLDGTECQSGLCLNGVCANPCASTPDCPNGFECVESAIPLDGGGTATLGVCLEAPEDCLADSNCEAGEVCLVDLTTSPAQLTCEDPVPGASDIGAPCASGAECRSGLCLDGMCSRPCERPNDCAADGSYLCSDVTVNTNDGGQSTLNACVPKPPTQCLSDSECSAPLRCVAKKSATAIEFVCGTPNAGGGEEGGTCTTDSQCAQNLCVDGVCTPPCGQNGDCSVSNFTCELVEVDLSTTASDNVQICTPPIACQSEAGCKTGEVCYVKRATAAIDLLCRAGNTLGATLGQVCTMDDDCRSNLCFTSRFGKVCSLPCVNDTECAVPGYACRSVGVLDAQGTPIQTSICAPKDPLACNANKACPSGTTCAIIPNTQGSALTEACIPSRGKLATGVACAADDECDSEVCYRGSCGAPCLTKTQCGVNQVCSQNVTLTKNALSGTFDVCERLTDIACTSSRDCAVGGRVCGDLRRDVTTMNVSLFCTFPHPNGAGLGASCTMNNECRDKLCQGLNNECSVACEFDSDCSATANQICSSVEYGTNNAVNICLRSCLDNASCSQGNICSISSDVPNNDIDQICTNPVGPKQLGEVCTTGDECDTGICLTTTLFDGRTCIQDNECTSGAGNAGKSCECPITQPNCTTGKQCATVGKRCTRVCNDSTDCIGGSLNNPLVSCSTNVQVRRPNGTGFKTLSTCGEPN